MTELRTKCVPFTFKRHV